MAMDPMAEGERIVGRVREGMDVYDASGEKIGTVRAVRIGDGNEPADARRQARDAIADVQSAVREPERPLATGDIAVVGVGGLVGDGGRPIGPLSGAAAVDPDDPDRRVVQGPLGGQIPDDELPRSERDRLIREGYIRIDSAGLFASDRYATADQIVAVEGGSVQLGVASNALLKDD